MLIEAERERRAAGIGAGDELVKRFEGSHWRTPLQNEVTMLAVRLSSPITST